MAATRCTSACAPCLLCGGAEWVEVREGRDLCRPAYQKVFRLMRCSACGMVSQVPIPDGGELSLAYSVAEDYVCYRPSWQQPGWPLWKILRAWTTARRLSRLKRYGRPGELLEIGCGAGDFLAAAHGAGWRVHAVEYNSEMAHSVGAHFGFDVRVGELAPGVWAEGSFDTVAIWNVLEHLQDPLRELTIAAAYLRSGGRVVLNIPTRASAEDGQWFGEYWALLDIPRHIHFFDKAALSRLCEKAGLKLVAYETPFVQSAWCYYMSCWRWANRDGRAAWRWPRFLALAAAVTASLPVLAWRAISGSGLESFAAAEKL